MRGRPQRFAFGLGAQAGRLARGAAALALAAGAIAAVGAAQGLSSDDRPRPRAAQTPDDPLFAQQWNLRAIGLPSAWAISRGEGAVVAVLDTGVAYRTRGPHRRAPDLAGTRFVDGWDFVDDDPFPDDVAPADGRRSHGTLMAGLIAQTTGNGIGSAGVAPAAAIMPIRVLKPDLSGSARAIARGLRFAADHGADIASVSIAGPSDTRAVRRAVDYAVGRGVTVVAASGNDGADSVSWPAADPQVIAVGAVARDLTRARYSNFGASLDIVAPAGAGDRANGPFGPGDGVLAQALKGGQAKFCFCFSASTSAAAAQVSGVAALLVGSGQVDGPREIRAALLAGARDLGSAGRDPVYGAGLVQARRSLGGRDAPAAASAPRPSSESGGARALWAAAAVAAVVVAIMLLARRRGRRTS